MFIELLEKYSLNEIFVFVIMIALSIKGIIGFFDWASERYLKRVNRQVKKEENEMEREDLISDLLKVQRQIQTELEKIRTTITVLVDSDKDDIKAWIVEKHAFFCYERGYIDDSSLDTIEKRYKHYKDEGGNSYIDRFMSEIRELPRHSNLYGRTDKKGGE